MYPFAHLLVLVVLESPTNPLFHVVDIPGAVSIVKRINPKAIVVVDNARLHIIFLLLLFIFSILFSFYFLFISSLLCLNLFGRP